ncbi:MAG: RodZ domain-containing protein, partial [Candidatus Binatia bacterium]
GIVTGLLAAGFVLLLTAPRQENTAAWMDEGEAPEETTAETPPSQPPAEAVAESSPQDTGTVAESPPPVAEQEVAAVLSAEEKVAAADVQEEVKTSEPPPAEKEAEAVPPLSAEAEKMEEETSSAGQPAETTEPPAEDQQVAAVSPPATPPPAPKPPPAQQTQRPAVKGPFELRVTAAQQQVWARVSIDGGPTKTVPLKPGQTVTWKAKRRYVLSLDDAGAVRASLNGKPLPKFGPTGRSRQNIVIPAS